VGASDELRVFEDWHSYGSKVDPADFQHIILTEETVEKLAEMTIPRGYSDARLPRTSKRKPEYRDVFAPAGIR